jgi:hypothetical protein
MQTQRGEYRYGSTLSLTSAVDRGRAVNAKYRSIYAEERDSVPTVQVAGWALGAGLNIIIIMMMIIIIVITLFTLDIPT